MNKEQTHGVRQLYTRVGLLFLRLLHNNFVHIAVTLGGIGLAALAALGVLLALNVNGLFEWNFGNAEIITLIWFVIGLALSAASLEVRQQRSSLEQQLEVAR